jgi:CubicO group peptidase (beta-lactamase class C family)
MTVTRYFFAAIIAMAGILAPAMGAHPGEVILGQCDGELTQVTATGSANIELSIDMTPHSVVRIASLTKQFTAVAVLALMEGGQLFLDDPVSQYIAGTPAHWSEITIRQLLSHTSGLTADMTPVFRRLHDEFSPEDLVEIFKTEPLITPPGAKWRYSNLNYWILGLVIEAVSGKPFSAYVNDRVVRPAMLDNTRYGDQRDIIRGRSAGYEIDGDGNIANARPFSTSIGYAAGGFVSTPLEIAQWYEALSKGKILAAETIKLALAPVETSDGTLTDYGLGWYITKTDQSLVAHHGGSTIGFTSYIYWTPESFAFAGIFRNWSDAAGEPADVVYDAFMGMNCVE